MRVVIPLIYIKFKFVYNNQPMVFAVDSWLFCNGSNLKIIIWHLLLFRIAFVCNQKKAHKKQTVNTFW